MISFFWKDGGVGRAASFPRAAGIGDEAGGAGGLVVFVGADCGVLNVSLINDRIEGAAPAASFLWGAFIFPALINNSS